MLIDTLLQKGLSISIKNGLLGISPKISLTDELRDFIRQNRTQILAEIQKAKLDSLLSGNDELREQFYFEVEERTAIMIFDGESNEAEVKALAYQTTLETW